MVDQQFQGRIADGIIRAYLGRAPSGERGSAATGKALRDRNGARCPSLLKRRLLG
jgi:hypothetical protein